MARMRSIYDFTLKWLVKFGNLNIDSSELLDHYMADDCAALGFMMDCGNAFKEVYGRAVYDQIELTRIIDDVTDIALLGSAIYSRWRYFNHNTYDSEAIFEPENRAWFILALDRLSVLAREKLYVFRGTLQRVHIVSNVIGCVSDLQLGDEVE